MINDDDLLAAKSLVEDADRYWAEAPKKETPSDRNHQKLLAMCHAIDSATRLFKAHNINPPTPLRILRRDLYEAIRGSSPDYFKNDLIKARPPGRVDKDGTKSILQAHSSVSIDLLLQANHGTLEECCRKTVTMLEKLNIPIDGKSNEKWKTVKSWRDELIRNGKKPRDPDSWYFYSFYLGDLKMRGNDDKFPTNIPEWYKKENLSFLNSKSPVKSKAELEKAAAATIEKFFKGWPNISCRPEELEELG